MIPVPAGCSGPEDQAPVTEKAAPKSADAERLARLVEQLGADEADKRDRASEELLKQALKDPEGTLATLPDSVADPEVRGRCEALRATLRRMLGLAEALRQVASHEPPDPSPDTLVRDASFRIQELLKGQPWSEVRWALKRCGFQTKKRFENSERKNYRVLVRKEAWKDGRDQAHDLTLELDVDLETEGRVAGGSGVVREALTGLEGAINRPYVEVLSQGRYPKDTAPDSVLRAPEAKAAAERYPILKAVKYTYGPLVENNHFRGEVSTVPFGYNVMLEFGEDAGNDGCGGRFFFTIRSHRDVPRDLEGNPVSGFSVSPALGEIQSWGSNEWRPAR